MCVNVHANLKRITDLQICVSVYSESRLILCSVIDIIHRKQKDLDIQTLNGLRYSFAKKKKKHFCKKNTETPKDVIYSQLKFTINRYIYPNLAA